MSRLPPLTSCLNCATPLQGDWCRLNGAAGLPFLVAIPVHLFLHLRGVYATGRLATLLCMALLATGTLVGIALLAISLATVGLLLNGG